MQLAIAQKNDEARLIEQNMSEKLNKQSAKLQEANDAINKKTTALAVANRAGKLRLCPSSNLETPSNTASTSADSRSGQTWILPLASRRAAPRICGGSR